MIAADPTFRTCAAACALSALLAGCITAPPTHPGDDARARLAVVGIELISEDEAGIPPTERGRYLPVRALSGFIGPPVPADPAGYLIVGIRDQKADDRESLLEALAAWDHGERLVLLVRRNPYASDEAEWREFTVPIRLP